MSFSWYSYAGALPAGPDDYIHMSFLPDYPVSSTTVVVVIHQRWILRSRYFYIPLQLQPKSWYIMRCRDLVRHFHWKFQTPVWGLSHGSINDQLEVCSTSTSIRTPKIPHATWASYVWFGFGHIFESHDVESLRNHRLQAPVVHASHKILYNRLSRSRPLLWWPPKMPHLQLQHRSEASMIVTSSEDRRSNKCMK